MASDVPNDAMHLSNQYRYKVQPPMQMPSPPTAEGGSSTSFKDAQQRVLPRDTSHHVHPWETLNHTPFIPSQSTSGPSSRSKKTTDGRTVREERIAQREEHTNAAKWKQEPRRSQFRTLNREEASLRTYDRKVNTKTNVHRSQRPREQQLNRVYGIIHGASVIESEQTSTCGTCEEEIEDFTVATTCRVCKRSFTSLQPPTPANPDESNRDAQKSPAPPFNYADGDRNDVMLHLMMNQSHILERLLDRLDHVETPRNQQVGDWIANQLTAIPRTTVTGLRQHCSTVLGKAQRDTLHANREGKGDATKVTQARNSLEFLPLLNSADEPHRQKTLKSHATDNNIPSIACDSESDQVHYSLNVVEAAVAEIYSHSKDEPREIQRLRRQACSTLTRFTEKLAAVPSDYGQDLASVKELQRKHQDAEHDLDTLEDVVNLLLEVAALLPSTTESEQIYAVLLDLEDHWACLSKTVKDRTDKLKESFAAHLFANCRDLILWFEDMKKRMSAAQLVEDVAGAKALLNDHEEYKREIDAREENFRLIVDAVVQLELMTDNDLVVTEAQDELETLAYERTALLDAWEDRLLRYELCIEANLFYRDVELATVRLSKQETLMDNNELNASLTSLDAQLENHKYLMESLAAEEATIKSLYDSSMELTEAHHFDSCKINKRMFTLLQRRSLFLVQVANRQKVLQSRKLLELPKNNNFQESRPVIISQSESRHNKSEHLLVHPLWATATEAESLTRDGEPPVANTIRDEDDWCQEKVNEREFLVLPTGQKNFAANYSIGKQHSDNNDNPSMLIRGHQIKPNETVEKDLDVDPLYAGTNEGEPLMRVIEPPFANRNRDKDEWCQTRMNEHFVSCSSTGQEDFVPIDSIGEQQTDVNDNSSTLSRGQHIQLNDSVENGEMVQPRDDIVTCYNDQGTQRISCVGKDCAALQKNSNYCNDHLIARDVRTETPNDLVAHPTWPTRTGVVPMTQWEDSLHTFSELRNFDLILLMYKWLKYTSQYRRISFPPQLAQQYGNVSTVYLTHYELQQWPAMDCDELRSTYTMVLLHEEQVQEIAQSKVHRKSELIATSGGDFQPVRSQLIHSRFYRCNTPVENFLVRICRYYWSNFLAARLDKDYELCLQLLEHIVTNFEAGSLIKIPPKRDDSVTELKWIRGRIEAPQRTISWDNVGWLPRNGNYMELIPMLKDSKRNNSAAVTGADNPNEENVCTDARGLDCGARCWDPGDQFPSLVTAALENDNDTTSRTRGVGRKIGRRRRWTLTNSRTDSEGGQTILEVKMKGSLHVGGDVNDRSNQIFGSRADRRRRLSTPDALAIVLCVAILFLAVLLFLFDLWPPNTL